MPYFKFSEQNMGGDIEGGREGDLPSSEQLKVAGPSFSSPIKANGSSAGAPAYGSVYLSRELPRPASSEFDGNLKLLSVADKARAWTNQRGQDSAWSKLKLHYDQINHENKCEDLQVIELERVVVTEWSLSWTQGSSRGVSEQLAVRAYKVSRTVDAHKAQLTLDAVESR
jgi:hypothetical protein